MKIHLLFLFKFNWNLRLVNLQYNAGRSLKDLWGKIHTGKEVAWRIIYNKKIVVRRKEQYIWMWQKPFKPIQDQSFGWENPWCVMGENEHQAFKTKIINVSMHSVNNAEATLPQLFLIWVETKRFLISTGPTFLPHYSMQLSHLVSDEKVLLTLHP